MRPMNKASFYLRHLWKSAFSNKPRVVLTFLGIFAGVLIFTMGNILIDSYYQSKISELSNLEDSAVLIQTSQENDGVFQKASKIFIVDETQPLVSLHIDSTEIMLSANLHGVTSSDGTYSLNAENAIYAVKSKIIAGRPIQVSDVITNNPVIVIDEFTKSILFPGQDALGRYVEIGAGGMDFQAGVAGGKSPEPLRLQVVGILENTYASNRNVSKLKKSLHDASPSVSLTTTVYCPYQIARQAYSESAHSFCYLFNEPNEARRDALTARLSRLTNTVQQKSGYCDVITRQTLTERLEDELHPLKVMLNLASAVMILICGIAIMSIIFFSIKERITEIGIRKTFGASKSDILFQFIFEALFLSLLASVSAALTGLATAFCLQNVISSVLLEEFEIYFSFRQLLLSVCLGCLQGVLFGMIPSACNPNHHNECAAF